MEGDILYPLNTLKETNRELYEKQAKKYIGREHVMEQFIPTLKCKWNDVLHFSPIHPEEIKKALIEAGIQTREGKFYQIDPAIFPVEDTTVYLYRHSKKENNMEPENFTSYDPTALEQYASVSEGTKAYYKEMYEKGERPLLYVKVPHILYKGSITIKDVPIITISGTEWKGYAEKTKNKPPAPLLIQAVESVTHKDKALDLGAGALNDTKYLLSANFKHVTALDSAPLAQEVADTLPTDRFMYSINKFADFDFPSNGYDLINAQYALPFNPPETFERVFNDIVDSLRQGGIFVGQLFGVRDEWNIPNSGKNFHTREDVQKLLSNLKIIHFEEEERERKTAAGPMKHWHVFHFIARKA
ncbi:MAG: class I SAM-dependent methyltransferase [Candidatus Pacebacteria bacterium]|nr:class I SAM-dependent methyltransferase [Candidatus Paceibacterota bacterium]